MEHGIPNQFEFSIGILLLEIEKTNNLLKHISKGIFYNRLKLRKVVLNLAILKLKGEEIDWKDFSYPIMILRRNISWLSKQTSVVPSSQKDIDEIKLASNLLTNKL